MTGPYKTRCPHCEAQFKISEEHLAQAKGAVRCGSCLRVFQATEHLLEGPPLVREETRPPAVDWSAALPEEAPAPATDGHDRPHAEDDGQLQLSDSFLSLEKEDPIPDLDLELGNHPHEQTDESWAEALLRELESDPEPKPEPVTADAEPATPEPARTEPEAATDDAFEFLNGPATARSAARRELDTPPRRSPLALLGWTAASLAALAVLAGQYLIFHFDSLSRDPRWRPAFAEACAVAGCTLPPRVDANRLRGTNLVVRSHPRFDNALVVDALLFNEASWPQPFPELELTFIDLQGKPVARRRFHADEYLRGELAGATAMPIRTPVHVSLEIVDPGRKAVSYHLRLLPAGETPAARLSDAH
jgi:predicted Zn finger-like uncharacterized protein